MKCSSADFQRTWPDLATCESRTTLGCTEALAAKNNANNPTKVEACATARQMQACPAYLDHYAPPSQCLPPSGKVANGSPCSFAGQCSSGFCALPPTSVCGVCAAPPNAGDSCAMQGCGLTMECVAATMTCQVPGASGASCSRMAPCGVGLACVGATGATPGMCKPQGSTVGAACDVRLMTNPNCDPSAGLTCDTSNNTCQTQQIAAAGASCGVIGTVYVACGGGSFCQHPPGTAMGTCIAPAADGAACDNALGPDCVYPARCITTGTSTAGTCQLPGSTSC